MHLNRAPSVAAVFALAAIASLAIDAARAQVSAPPSAAGASSNDLQRSVEVFGYNVAAKSGATRGEVIYYYKCWNCHNDYTRAAGSPAPTLKGVFSRTTLVTGDPVNDENVAKQIRNGSPQMPSFGTTLKDADIADLLAYLHNGCCYEETNPPVNPWYRANAQNSPAMPERGNLRGGPNGTVRAAARRPPRRHHGAADRAQRGAHHGHQQPGRPIRIPAARCPAPIRCASPSRCSSCPISATA